MKPFLGFYLMGKKHQWTPDSDPCLVFGACSPKGAGSKTLREGRLTKRLFRLARLPPRTTGRIGTATPPYVHIRRARTRFDRKSISPKTEGVWVQTLKGD